MQVKSRHHLRSDAVSEVRTALRDRLGVDPGDGQYERVEFEDDATELVLVDGEPLVFYVEGAPFVTVQGANAFEPERRVVTVDAGAVSFVSDGADVMRPGITDVDAAIDADDLVVVAEETHGKFLAVGRALVDGDDMLGDEGRVVASIHHVGDDLYEFHP